MAEQRVDVLRDVVIARPVPETLGRVVVVGERHPRDVGEVVRTERQSGSGPRYVVRRSQSPNGIVTLKFQRCISSGV